MLLTNIKYDKVMYSKEKIQQKLQVGLQYHKSGNIDQAQIAYNEVLEADPDNADAWHLMGDIACQIERYDLAEEFVLRAIDFSKSDKYFITLGKIYEALKDFDKAINSYKESLKLNPKNAAVFNLLGVAFFDWKKYSESESYYRKSLEINPNQANVLYNLGNVLLYQNKIEKAINAYLKVIELNPNSVESFYNLGVAYCLANNFKEGEKYYQKALKINPECLEAFVNFAVLNLLQGDFDTGWALYEKARLVKEKNAGIDQEMLNNRWKGQNLQNKKIYVYNDQGIGDTIFSLRYLPVLKAMGADILIKPQAGLASLIRENFSDVELIESSLQAEAVGFDFYSPLYHLTCAFKQNLSNIPSVKLKANADKVLFYKENYFNTDKPKVGIIWQGNPDFTNDRNRSLPLEFFYDLLNIPDIKVYSFQSGYGIEQLEKVPDGLDLIDVGSSFKDFSDTAAAVENLDLLITIDSAVAHLAGSLEKQTAMLIPSFPDWRWRLEGEDCFWYKNLKILRQKNFNNWDDVKERLLAVINGL